MQSWQELGIGTSFLFKVCLKTTHGQQTFFKKTSWNQILMWNCPDLATQPSGCGEAEIKSRHNPIPRSLWKQGTQSSTLTKRSVEHFTGSLFSPRCRLEDWLWSRGSLNPPYHRNSLILKIRHYVGTTYKFWEARVLKTLNLFISHMIMVFVVKMFSPKREMLWRLFTE